jgi:membrane-associated phospholipid phosphatase
MKSTLLRVRFFIGLHALVFCLSIGVIFSVEKMSLHLWFNQWHNEFFDPFFSFATHMAEGWFIGVIVLLALLYKLRYGIAGLIGIALSGITTQLLKRLIFSDQFRPTKVFEGIADLHLVQGVTMHSNHSFPSGHATGAFALFLFSAFLFNNKWLQLLSYFLALITAYSRVYLSQHFFEDIVAGSMIGILVCLGVLTLIVNQSWGEKGLLETLGIKRP